MKGLSDTDRKAYEAYIIAKDDQEREEAIKKLIPGSALYYYLYFIDKMKKVGADLTEQDLQVMQQFSSRYPQSRQYQKVKARLEMYQYDQAKTPEEKEKMIKNLRERGETLKALSFLTFDHVKPEDMRRQDDSQSSQSEDESSPKVQPSAGIQGDLLDIFGNSSSQYNFGSISVVPKTKPHELNYDLYFSKQKLQERYLPTRQEHLDTQRLMSIPSSYLQKINFQSYHLSAVHSWASQYRNLRVPDLENQTFFLALTQFFSSQYQINQWFQINQTLLSNLTIQQIDKLCVLLPQIKSDKNLIGTYFRKQFHEELSQENQEVWNNEEKRANLLHLYSYAKTNNLPISLLQSLLIEILTLGIKLDTYEEIQFIEYLKNPLYSSGEGFLKNHLYSCGDSHWASYISNVQTQMNREGKWHETQKDLINSYLEHFCEANNGSLDKFRDYFELEFLQKICEKIAIYNSDDLTNLVNVDIKKYQQVSSEVQIKFLESNPDTFKVQEEVKLVLQIKNVQTLYVKIFEFNTETYYKKTLQPFNTGVNLDGLIASIEKQFEYKHPPNKKFLETFAFPELTDKIGLFIVEFIGNGLSSRAVIKKGQLSLIHKPTIAGHLAYIIDENKNICSGPKTGVYFESQYYASDPEKNGKIFIPYGSTSIVSKAILINNGFAQLCDFERQSESYSFSCIALLNSECVLIGKKAQIFIKPTLTINGRPASLSLLTNTKIEITTVNFIDNIPVTKKFENIKFTDNQEFILDFQVPPYLQSISLSLTTEVYSLTERKAKPFSFNRSFGIAQNQNTKNMSDVYLRKEQGDYYLYLLGKNGEPKKNVNTLVKLIHPKIGMHEEQGVNITTDKNGRIKLGNLKNIFGLEVYVALFNINKHFLLPVNRQYLTYPSSVDLNENDAFELPVFFREKKRSKVMLIKHQDHQMLEDLFDQIGFVPQEDKDYNKITIDGLSDGTYLLQLKDIDHHISITVHKGQYWEGDQFILKRNQLFENRAASKIVKIQKATVEEAKEGTQSEIVIKLEDFTQNTRVHVQANLFEPQVSAMTFMTIYKDLNVQFSKTVFPFAMWKNIFMNNRELSDEFRYVFDRRYAERFQGNTLERPRLVLKRTLVGITSVDQEQLRQGTAFAQQIGKQQEVQYMSQNIAPMSYMQNTQPIQQQSIQLRSQNIGSSSYDMFGGPTSTTTTSTKAFQGPQGEFSYLKLCQMVSEIQSQINASDMQHFLKQSPLQLFNLVPNENGEVRFKANLAPFTQLTITAVDLMSVAEKKIDLIVNPIQKRDLSLFKPLDVEKGFTESRITQNISQGEIVQIEDMTSTEIQLIDDFKKVRGVLDELMRMSGTNLIVQNVYQELIDSVVFKWLKPSTTTEDKHKMFSKHFCHELNIFIYMRDREYFDKTVKPFLEHKMEKTFVDHYLLQNHNECLKFFNLMKIHLLNPLEQCFLVDVLCQLDRREDALKIIDSMKMRRDQIEVTDRNQLNRVFDTVLNMNMQKPQTVPSLNLLDDFAPMNQPIENAFDISQVNFGASQADPFGGFEAFSFNNAQPAQMNIQNNAAAGALFGGGMMGGGGFGAQPNAALFNNLAQARQMPQAQQQMMRMNRAVNQIQSQNMAASPSYQHQNYQSLVNSDLFDIQNAYNDQKRNQKLKFEELQQTNEYVDTNYFQQKTYLSQQSRFIINSFYIDYALYLSSEDKAGSFLTSNFIKNSNSNASAFITFALLDLPLESAQHQFQTNEGRGLSIQTGNNVILFKKEVREAQQEITNDILVIHRYVRTDQSTSTSAALPEEFLTNTAYQCEVIMTNVSPQHKEFSILYQIPQGSLPIEQSKYMKSTPQSLSAYTTTKLLFYFYFPKEGDFIHFPSNVSCEDKIIAKAQTNQLKVVHRLSVNKKETFKEIVQSGNREDILEFLRTENLIKFNRGFDVSIILWMLKEKDFYLKVVEVLRNRMLHLDQVWKFSLFHGDEQSTREYLSLVAPQYNLQKLFGKTFESTLLSYDEFDKEIKHFDYYPMINSRAHQVGDIQTWTLNKNVRKTYDRFLKRVVELKEFSLKDKMMMVYYLQLQDRIKEAINLLDTIKIGDDDEDKTLKLQFDYFTAYFDFFTGQSEGFKTARTIVRKYEDYPVASWRMAFLEILDQLNEYDGEIEDVQEIDEDNMSEELKKQKMKQSIAKEPRFEVEVNGEKQKISVEVANIKQIVIKFYIIDAEILFSRTPFLKDNTEEFSYVKPCHVLERDLSNVDLNSSIDTVTYLQQPQKIDIEIPENLKNQNMVIEFNGQGKQIFKTYYSTQIKVHIQEAYGELKVTDNNGSPMPKVYVKVFYQKKDDASQTALFFRDGYTDIRGKFEYAQTSGSKLGQVKKFAILVLSDNLGSIIRECNPPKFDAPVSKDIDIYGAESQQQMMKQQRIIQKTAWHKENYKR